MTGGSGFGPRSNERRGTAPGRRADVARLVRPVMGRQGPDRALLAGATATALGDTRPRPWRRRACGPALRCPRAGAPGRAKRRTRGRTRGQTARPIAATTAVAVGRPTPGISAIRRPAALPRWRGPIRRRMDVFRYARGDVGVAGRRSAALHPAPGGDFLPAGPDGISRSAPHFSRGLAAPGGIQAWRISVVPCAIFRQPPPVSVRVAVADRA